MIKAIAFTIYAVTDMARSRAFYEGILGLVPSPDFGSENWVEYNIGEGTFTLGCSPDWKPSQEGAVISFEVDDLDAMVAKLKAANVTFKLDAMTFPSCSMAVIKDPDMNNVMIHKIKKA